MSKMLTYLLAGIAIGILIAPDKGSATRQRLADSFSGLVDDAQDKAGEIGDRIMDTAEDVSDDVKGAAKDIKKDVKNKWA